MTSALVGDYEVRLIPTGTGSFPGSMVFWGSDHLVRHDLTFHSVLIRGHGRTILINTGFPDDLAPVNDAYSRSMGTTIAHDENLVDALATLGVGPEGVTDVILAPLGLYSTGAALRFSDATFWIAREGWVSFHTSPDHPHDRPDSTIPPSLLAWLTGAGRAQLRLVDDDEIAPGIRAWWTGGHHRASMCIEVATDTAPLAISDVYFHERNFTDDHPVGMSENIYEILDAYRRIRRSGAVAVPLFDPGNRTRFPGGVVGVAS
ncbi:hypothetical protein [Rhodococcoides kyotonense]|uniref:MBL fold metallo-hydrolase n=1 Tax=Rhodococcoides kyotonense TaxID=398843 RepID=A0A239E0D6_9NOCA|nr:hypothetical protein [Rhodococcus kyotonensis]SNS37738.1 hypothetical protein SAMN05421642_102120 [Rhodococcus kyotonensis]